MKVLVLTETQDTSMTELKAADIVAIRRGEGYEVVRLYKVFITPQVFSKLEFYELLDTATK